MVSVTRRCNIQVLLRERTAQLQAAWVSRHHPHAVTPTVTGMLATIIEQPSEGGSAHADCQVPILLSDPVLHIDSNSEIMNNEPLVLEEVQR